MDIMAWQQRWLMVLAASWDRGPRGEDNSKAAVRVPGEPEFYIKTEIVEDNDGQ